MPKTYPYPEDNSDEYTAKHSQVRGVRRQRQAARAKRNQPRHTSRQKERNLVVRAELRDQPDVRKIARAVIHMATVQAELDARTKAREANTETPRV